MAQVYETQYVLSAKDEASEIFRKYNAEISQLTQAHQKAGQETSRLTQFIRQQRTEQRQQTFLYREATQAVSQLTERLGIGTESTRKLTSSLSGGFQTFQALDFATASLGLKFGALGIAATGAVAAGVALYDFFDRTKERAELAAKGITKLQGSLVGLSEVQKTDLLEKARKDLRAMEKQLKESQSVVQETARQGILGGPISATQLQQIQVDRVQELQQSIAFQREYIKLLEQNRKSEEQIKLEQTQRVRSLEQQLDLTRAQGTIRERLLQAEFEYKKVVDDIEATKQEKELAKQILDLKREQVIAERALKNLQKGEIKTKAAEAIENQFPEIKAIQKLNAEWAKLPTSLRLFLTKRRTEEQIRNIKGVNVPGFDLPDTETMKQFAREWENTMQVMRSVSASVAGDIYNFFSGATQGISGLFRSMANSIVDRMKQMAAELAADALFSLFLSFLFPSVGFGKIFKQFSPLGGLFGRAAAPVAIATPARSTPVVVNFNINAMNARDVKRAMQDPSYRRAIISTISDATRKGIVE
jgi:hypothetical protein